MENLQQSDYDIVKKDNILFVDVQNIFDAEAFAQYHLDMIELTQQMKHQPWASLIIYHGSGVFTPEVEDNIADVTKYRVQHNMIANATVFLDSTHADIQQMQLRRIYNGCHLPFYVFSDVKSAENWLQDFLGQQPQAM
ncbi:hypothetical protein HII17_09705 [Thalassotalea sp. M1531]|uniref:STAS/SEC14 domain-containing protein n=1 Tax=Thalassotalea algicola TaxID=2716224 RepID=A0A7Y0LC52_9GAMM|nr:hypothetical protein [Thalassotalea algicola]NMP31839.1 hypothetical protein [Thalassotalea algicola]